VLCAKVILIFDGGVRVIYRIIGPETTTPSTIAGKKITIMPYSATVVESEGKGAHHPLNLALFLFFLKKEYEFRYKLLF
jgi:hypothetical protein